MAGAALGWVIEACSRASLLLALAIALGICLRRAPARARHLWWASALAGALAMAFLSPVVPSWRLPILPSLGTAVGTSDPPAPAMAREWPTLSSSVPAPDRAPMFQPSAAAPTSPPDRAPRFASGGLSPLTGTALGLWVIGSAGTIGWLLVGLRRARGLARRAHRAEGQSWGLLRGDLEERVGLRREITLLTSAEVDTPVTWGWLRPVVLMPSEAEAWCPERRRLALAHEMAHVRRKDWLAQMLAHVACSVYWFVPMAWMARRRMRLESEKACDESVVEMGTRPSEYASHLLEMSESLQPGPLAAVATLTTRHRSHVEARIMSILSFKRPIARMRLVLAAALAGMVGLILSVSSVIPWADPRPSGGAPARRAAESGVSTPAPSAPEPAAPDSSAEAAEDPEPEVAPEEAWTPMPEAWADAGAAYEAVLALSAASAAKASSGSDRRSTWSEGDARFALRIAGEVDLDEDGHIMAMEPGASIVLEAVTPESEIRLEITQPEGGARLHEWIVNGFARPFDETAARWMTSMLAVEQARDGWSQLLWSPVDHQAQMEALERFQRAQPDTAHLEIQAALEGRLREMQHRDSLIQGRVSELQSHQEALRATAAGMRAQLESLPPVDVDDPAAETGDEGRASEPRALALKDQLSRLERQIASTVEKRIRELVRELESLRPQQQELERKIQSLSQDTIWQQGLLGPQEGAAALEAMAAGSQDERARHLSEELQRLTEEIGRAAGMEL